TEAPGLAVDPEIAAAVEQAAKAFASAGAIVEPMRPFLTRTMLDGVDHFWRTRAWVDIAALDATKRAKVLPYIRAWAESGANYAGVECFAHFTQLILMRQAANVACRACDFVLSPTAPVPAFAAELPSPTNDPLRPLEHIGFTVAFNMSEQPAATINCGYTK